MQLPDHTNGTEQEVNEFRLLKNPLPAPVRKSHVRMEFDLQDPEEGSEAEFDYLISDDDDFDI